MRVRSAHSVITTMVLAGAFALGGGSIFAEDKGQGTTTNDGGTPVDPEPGATADTSWNPNYHCVAEEGETLREFLACLASYVDGQFFCSPYPTGGGNPGGGTVEPVPGMKGGQIPPCGPEWESAEEYTVNYAYAENDLANANPIGITMRLKVGYPDTTDGYEHGPYRLRLHETSHNIQRTSVDVPRPNLYAKIHLIVGTPTGGQIKVKLDSTVIPPLYTYAANPTTGLYPGNLTLSAYLTKLNKDLAGKINHAVGAAYIANIMNENIVISRTGGVNHVEYSSTDYGLYESEIRLTPSVMDVPDNETEPEGGGEL